MYDLVMSLLEIIRMIESAEEFHRLRTSDVPEEYYRAAHEEAPLSVWRDVMLRFPEMRFWVAQNKTVPVEILELLVHDPDPRVRHMVAMKRKLPEHLQLRLAHDPDEGIRLAIACNAKATPEVLHILLADDWSEVRENAKTRLAGVE